MLPFTDMDLRPGVARAVKLLPPSLTDSEERTGIHGIFSFTAGRLLDQWGSIASLSASVAERVGDASAVRREGHRPRVDQRGTSGHLRH